MRAALTVSLAVDTFLLPVKQHIEACWLPFNYAVRNEGHLTQLLGLYADFDMNSLGGIMRNQAQLIMVCLDDIHGGASISWPSYTSEFEFQ